MQPSTTKVTIHTNLAVHKHTDVILYLSRISEAKSLIPRQINCTQYSSSILIIILNQPNTREFHINKWESVVLTLEIYILLMSIYNTLAYA